MIIIHHVKDILILFLASFSTGLPTKDETMKTTQNYKNMTIFSLIFYFFIQSSTWMICCMVKNRNKPFLAYKEPLFLIFLTETILRTDEGQPRPKYTFNKCGTNIYFFTLQRFRPSPSPNFKERPYTCKKTDSVKSSLLSLILWWVTLFIVSLKH